MTLKKIFVLFAFASSLTFLLTQCKSFEKSVQPNPTDITIVSASMSEWSSGAKGHGSGMGYKIVLVPNVDNIEFQYLCADSGKIEIRLSKQMEFIPKGTLLVKGDTLLLSASYSNEEVLKPCEDKLNNSQAMLYYIVSNSEIKKSLIQNIVEQKAKPRP